MHKNDIATVMPIDSLRRNSDMTEKISKDNIYVRSIYVYVRSYVCPSSK